MTIHHMPQDDSESFWVLGDHLTLRGGIPGTDWSLVSVEVPPGSGTPLHRHPAGEMFRVTRGCVTFALGQGDGIREIVAGPGDTVAVPGGAVHRYANRSTEPAAFDVWLQDSLVAFFRDLASPVPPPPGPPPAEAMARVMQACSRHGIEILAAA